MNEHKKSQTHQQDEKQPVLLSDKPETTDFFGAHTGIANALADLILHDNEGRCVAIEGAWGSGKSTVIGMLQDKLSGKANVLVFDTWSNQGDPLRYSFMMEFASWIKGHYPKLQIQSRKWLEEVEDAASKATRETRDPGIEKPKQAQRLAAALLVGMPLGLALASDQWTKLFGDVVASIFYITGIVLVFLPILYLAKLRLFNDFDLFKEIVDAIERAADDTKRIVVKRGPLATSLEFGRKISVMCEALHKQADHKKLLIIFDNIDRVAERNSPKVWSLLTALLETVHDKKKEFASSIWVLVPVDLDTVPVPVSVSRDDAEGDVTESVVQDGKIEGTNSLKREFIEKTFQLTVVVPPPLSVASERYFKQQYKDAFGGTTAERDWYECYAVLRDIRGSDESFTPREIKRFINDLVGLWRSRKQIDANDMPTIPLMTFYLCSRHKIGHPNDLVQTFIPWELRQHIADKNPIASLAAVAFGDKMSNGLLLLVKAQADGVVETGDVSRFGDVVSADGFAEAFANYVQERGPTWLVNDSAALAKAYSVIGKFDQTIEQDIAARLPGLTRDLLVVNPATGKMDPIAAQGVAHAAYLVKATKSELEQSLQAILTLIAEGPGAPTPEMGSLWVACADAYLKELVDRSIAFDDVRIELPQKPEQAVQILRGSVLDLYERGKIELALAGAALTSINQTLVGEAANFNLNESSLKVVKSLRRIAQGFDSSQACSALQGRLQNANGMNADQLSAAIALVDDTLNYPNGQAFRPTALNWVQTGFLLHHFQLAQGDKQSLAARLAGLMAGLGPTSASVSSWNQAHPGLANFQQSCNTMSGPALANAFQYLCDAGRFHEIVHHASSFNLNPFREGLLRMMLTTRPSLYTAETYCTEIPPIFGALSPQLRADLTKYAIEQLGVDGYLEKRETADPTLGFSGYLEIGTAISEPSRQKAFYIRVAALLRSQGLEWWQNTVKGTDQTLLTLLNTISQLLEPGWLSGEARKVAGEWVHSPDFMSNAGRKAYTVALMKALAPSERTVILVQVVTKAVLQPNDMTEFGRVRDLADFLFVDNEVLAKLDDIANSVLVPAIDHDPQSRVEAIGIVEKYRLTERVTGEAKRRLQAALQPAPSQTT